MLRRLAMATAIAIAFTAAPASAQTKNLVDTASAAGSFSTLVRALKATGLNDTLKGTGPFTVFAPTDEAFKKLPEATRELLRKDRNFLKAVLSYHVVAGKVMAADVVKLNQAKTVQGQSVTIAATGSAVSVDNAKVIKTDVAASNGVIHVIDTVMLPKASN
jgi:uncharacterized surface protein with fasciclin (FAS1) repeats